ncbi:MAG TPA: AI-2E family transporter [Fimbriimonas sp.]
MEIGWEGIYKALARAIWLAAGVVILVWFLDEITSTVLFALLTLVLSIGFSAPVTALEERRVPRWLGTLLVFIAVAGIFTVLGYLVAPRLAEQGTVLLQNAPEYAKSIQLQIAGALHDYPEIQRRLRFDDAQVVDRTMPLIQGFVSKAGRYTVSIVGLVLGAVLLATAVGYACVSPRPLLSGYLNLFPPGLHESAARAYARGSQSVVGWLWSNVTVGAIEAVLTYPFLLWLGIPGAAVWATFVFFAELIPKIGSYILAIPPMLVALAIEPIKAVWVALFFVILQWLVGDIVGAVVRAKQMRIHAVTVIVATIAMGAAFGLLGAILSMPIVGFVKAFYEEFYLKRHAPDPLEAERVEAMLTRREDLLRPDPNPVEG